MDLIGTNLTGVILELASSMERREITYSMSEELTALLFDLVAINSINPDLIPGAPGEAEIAAFIARWLEKAGLEVQLVETISGRPNVVGIARGTGGGKTLLLNGHMDTVGFSGMEEGWQPRIHDGRLYGRGAYDMKGGLAACMSAVTRARREHLRGDVILTAVIDEEYASLGTQDLAGQFRADGAIVAEFTELQIILAHRGFVWLELETLGRAAHGSRPDLGVDAIIKMGQVLKELEDLDQELRSYSTHPLLKSGSLHASLIQGGQEKSSYPESCRLWVERRTLPGESPEQVKGEITRILQKLQVLDPTFNAEVRLDLHRSSLQTAPDTEIARVVRSAAAHVLGRDAEIAGVPFWTDAALLSTAGIPSLLFGPSGEGAHASEEWVDLASVQACADVYLAAALEFCR